MSGAKHRLRLWALGTSMLLSIPAMAAEVTFERIVNADKEPQNWLTNHRTYNGQRYSPLDKINKVNVKGMKLAYAVALGGSAPAENIEATPLVEDGFMYIVDQWPSSTRSMCARGIRAGSCGAWIQARKSLQPGQTAALPCPAIM